MTKWQRIGAAILTGLVSAMVILGTTEGRAPSWVYVLVGVLSFIAWDASFWEEESG